jgi:hypothetical protein
MAVSAEGVRAYQTERTVPAQLVGSSGAAEAASVSTVSVNGSSVIAVALLKSSFGGGTCAMTLKLRVPPPPRGLVTIT